MTRLLAAVLLLAACAASAPREGRRDRARRPESTLTGGHEREIEAASSEIRRLEGLLSDAEVQATPPDCARIAQLRDNICDLAARICQLAEREPQGSPALADVLLACTDGQGRCKKAVERAQARGCPPKK